MSHPSTPWRLLIARQDLRSSRIATDLDATRPLADGEARFAVEHFAITANNITYAAFGEAMQYWRFFPAAEAGFGCLPVWGYARVAESRCEGLDEGERFWGYWPAGSHLVVQPVKVDGHGFTDGAAHRAELAVIYNRYRRAGAADVQAEGIEAVLRPLFATSFLIDDFLAENGFFGARQVLMSSASSKTAYGTAFCLGRLRARDSARPSTVGLTSASRVAFTQGLAGWDHVLGYDGWAEAVDATQPAIYVDFSGDAALRRAVHERFGERLMHSASIGGTHWEALGSGRGLPGPKPTLFFAPSQWKARSAPPPAGLGAAEFQRRMDAAWTAFTASLRDAGDSALRLHWAEGAEATQAAYLSMLEGRVDASLGLMLRSGA
jgi:hypothetical protein